MKELRYKACNKTTIADAYKVSLYTLQKWLLPFEKRLGDYIGGLYTPKQVAVIVEHLGQPENLQLISV
ncbi:hypothetical protein [Aquimarina mytili]|uniref:DUF4248 domain-containing protein n=1 Tax=Aquimarina mytili TaxID=874423 RepID=A0A937A4Q8_9FLAO|nr:hypothetical protein [Aquimarina mytili]MBL0684304.1 hypothetical protein [Aquimarina mytili]